MIRDLYIEQDNPLYYWKLHLDGKITKVVVKEYKINHYGRETHYLFKIRNTVHSVRKDQLNRLTNNRVCSFEDDDKKVTKIIEDVLEARASKYRFEYENATKLLELVRTNN